MPYKLKYYKTEHDNAPLKDFINELRKENDQNSLNKISLYTKHLIEYGLEMNRKFKRESYKKLDKNLYELRPGSSRIFFFFISNDDQFILINGFKKKSKETPKNEIEKAMRARDDYNRRLNHE